MTFLTIALLVVVVVIAIAVYFHAQRSAARFNERFPPIDDDEFVRRCTPGVNRDIALRVRRMVSTSLGIEYERIYPDQRFVDDLGCD